MFKISFIIFGIFIWCSFGALSIPIRLKSFPNQPMTRGETIINVVSGPLTLTMYSVAWLILDNKCVANCKE